MGSPKTDLDFSCYVTVMNQSSLALSDITYDAEGGSFDPIPPTSLAAKVGQAYFVLTSDASRGKVSCQVGEGQIGLAFSCPYIGDNTAYVYLQTSGDVTVRNYGVIGTYEWDPQGSNWPTENNIPTAGHPLSVLFVVSDA